MEKQHIDFGPGQSRYPARQRDSTFLLALEHPKCADSILFSSLMLPETDLFCVYMYMGSTTSICTVYLIANVVYIQLEMRACMYRWPPPALLLLVASGRITVP